VLLLRMAILALALVVMLSPSKVYADASVSPAPLMIFQHEAKQWVFDLRSIGFDGIDPTTLNRQAFMAWFSVTVEKEINRPARSAYYKKRKMVPHQWGLMVDRQQLERWLDHVHEHLNRPLTLPVIRLKPRVTTEELKKVKGKMLGTYTTWFNPRNYNRAHNIRLSAEAIDHQLILPGQLFSFNHWVGIRSLKRGYLPARIIVKGEYSEGVGGGICQTSSTLFNSADQAGLTIIERISHSKRVAYVPEGRDATVSWGGPDFQFQNPFDEPILIEATAKGGRLTVNIYGPSTIRHTPKTIQSAPREVEDETESSA